MQCILEQFACTAITQSSKFEGIKSTTKKAKGNPAD